jgi:hypothetical protein
MTEVNQTTNEIVVSGIDTTVSVTPTAAGPNVTVNRGLQNISVSPSAIASETSVGMIGPQGATGSQGPQGPQGPAGIVIQSTAPSDTSVVWADTSSTGSLFAPYRLNTSVKSANYTLALTDEQTLIEVSAAATITVPTNASVAFAIGTQINLLATGTGSVTVFPASGVTVNATPSLILRSQWSSATLIKRATNTWVLVGDLA